MIIYLASPNNQVQAAALDNMPALLSYSSWDPWLDQYHPSFSRILIDSGAFSELTGHAKVDLCRYSEWAARWNGHADAIAGLDDIGGDWKRSLANYEAFPGGFPTFHEADPPELLDDLVALAQSRGQWIGLGLTPPRHGKEGWVRRTCDRIPDGIHVHGWALREYTHVRLLDSVDSTNWWRDAMGVRKQLPWLTYSECCELIVKRYQRWRRTITEPQPSLFS